MNDPRVDKLANLLTNYCVAVQPGQQIAIRGSIAALPLMRASMREVLRAGGHPSIFLNDEPMSEIFLEEANEDQLDYVSPINEIVSTTFDGLISIRATNNTRQMANSDPAKQQRNARAQRELQKVFFQRSAEGKVNWVGTIFPTNAYAQDADMSLRDYTDFYFNACHIDKADPVAEWQKVAARHQKLVDFLANKHKVTVKGPNIDLSLEIGGRTFINGDGRHNMPCGEIFTGPVEESVNGWVKFTYPAIHAAREVDGIELRFEDGKVVDASAKKNEAYLLEVLDTDPGARYLGEFAIGTNNGIKQFTKSILFDEKIGGTIHMAVGSSYPESGGKNVSSVHWDMICDMRDGGQIFVDDELFYDSGRFLLLGE